MCTVSWGSAGKDLTLFFNRDEQRSRTPAKPPHLSILNNVKCLYPVDPDGGGSWLGVNEYGLILGILNYYEREPSSSARSENFKSRGLLLIDLLPTPCLSRIEDELHSRELTVYPPFHFFAIQNLEEILFTWDGHGLRSSITQPPITTSSVQPAQVAAFRKQHFPSGSLDPEALRNFHYLQDPGNASFSPRMEREHTRTVSISEIRIDHQEVTFCYDNFDSPLHTSHLQLRQGEL